MRWEQISNQDPLYCNVCMETNLDYCIICQENIDEEITFKARLKGKKTLWKMKTFLTKPDVYRFNRDFDLQFYTRLLNMEKDEFFKLEFVYHQKCNRELSKLRNLYSVLNERQQELGIDRKCFQKFDRHEIKKMLDYENRSFALTLDDLNLSVRNSVKLAEDQNAHDLDPENNSDLDIQRSNDLDLQRRNNLDPQQNLNATM